MKIKKFVREIYLAGGCFWGTEKYLSNINGVIETEVGYANGNTQNPTYEEVCKSDTGHAETVRVIYDDSVSGLDFILKLFFNIINPISINQQGGDIGSQYRTGVYYSDEDDLPLIQNAIYELQQDYCEKIVTEILPLKNFYAAEEYHQKYLDKNPGGYCHISQLEIEEVKQYIDKTRL